VKTGSGAGVRESCAAWRSGECDMSVFLLKNRLDRVRVYVGLDESLA
jgi:hypothetical protein